VTEDLANFSLVAVYSAMAIYTISFVAFALDLAKRSGDAQQAPAASATATAGPDAGSVRGAGRGSARAAVSGGSTIVLDREAATAVSSGDGRGTGSAGTSGPGSSRRRRGSTFERVATAMMVLGLLVHVSSVVTRGLAAERVPWANMFEFSLTGTAIIVAVYLVAGRFVDLSFLGAYVMGLNLVLLAIGSVNYYVEVVPLQPALQSAWLVIHVLVAILGTGFFAIAAGLSIAQLIQTKREQARLSGLRFPPPTASRTWRTASPSSASSSGPSPSSPAPSGPSARGVATGAGTPKRCGPSSSGSSTPATSTPGRPAAGAVRARRGCRSSASLRCCSTSAS
jgi:hypothetical protein